MKDILIIEDDKELREEICEILTYENYDVARAADGEEGLRKARMVHPLLVLCDIMLPDVNGFEILKQLQESNPESVIVFITALSDRENFRTGMELGADDYLTKPFSREELINAVHFGLQRFQRSEKLIKKKIEKIIAEESKKINSLSKRGTIYSTHASCGHNQVATENASSLEDTIALVEKGNILRCIKEKVFREIGNSCSPEENKILTNIKSQIVSPNYLWDNLSLFQLQFTKRNPGIKVKIENRHPDLTRYEIMFVMATFIELNTNQIAALFSVSPSSVRKSRYRIKKKLNLTNADDFYSYVRLFQAD